MTAERLFSADLNKLTVPQLKVLCKERRSTGYSKLTKNALILKLTTAGQSHADPPSLNASVSGDGTSDRSLDVLAPPAYIQSPSSTQSAPTRHTEKFQALATKYSAQPLTSFSNSKPSEAQNDAVPMVIAPLPPFHIHTSPSTSGDVSATNSALTSAPDARALLKRPLEASLAAGSYIPQKKQKTSVMLSNPTSLTLASAALISSPVSRPIVQVSSEPAKTLSMGLSPATTLTGPHRQASPSANSFTTNRAIGTYMPALLQRNTHPPRSSYTGRRFKPLFPHGTAQTPATISVTSEFSDANVPISLNASSNLYASFRYLDVAPTPDITLEPISYPPSLSQRKRVHGWAVILSGLSNAERKQCVLVSRMFRYAVYLSASQILTQNFSGRRLAWMCNQYSQMMTNMWPYLRQRELELHSRRKAYVSSFLGQIFGVSRVHPISERLWTSPDHESQLIVALRFVMTRLWFAISIGSEKGSNWSTGVVVDVQEVVKDEIWTVSVAHRTEASQMEHFYVLQSTCEVVGRPTNLDPVGPFASNGHGINIPLRADWSSYISHRLLPPSIHKSPPPPLIDHLKCSNNEEYEKGISRLWLKRISGEGSLGQRKRDVAERYVMACVVENSVSGQWQSVSQMSQEFAGIPKTFTPSMLKARAPQVNLYLPAHHHVESVNFFSSNQARSPLHPSLAVVQTPGREYYILKDNGMQVGCEEDGVGAVWMQILGCDGNGLHT